MNPRRRAFTLLELVVVCAVGAFIAVVTAVALRNSAKVFTSTSSRDGAVRHLLKARRVLENDLILASLQPNHLFIQPAPGTRGGGADGDAVNFLSAVNSTSERVETLVDGSGSPYYFENIVYYPTTPTNHDALYAMSCAGGNEGGYDYVCPHKVLLRRVEDQNATFNPADATTQDVLLGALLPPITGQPTGFPKQVNLNTVAINLLSFRVERQGAELIVDLRAVGIHEARSRMRLGTQSLLNSPFSIEQRFSVFPKN